MDFPTWGSGKGTNNPQGILFGGQWDLIAELPRTGNRFEVNVCLYKQSTKLCAHQKPRDRSSVPTRDWPRLPCECPGVSGGVLGWQWPAVGSSHWIQHCVHKSFWRSPLLKLPLPQFASGQTTGREHSLTHQQRVGLKIYWAWLRPSEWDLVSPTVTLSHQEASTSLLSLSIRGQTEWKPQPQKTNQTDHMDHSLV